MKRFRRDLLIIIMTVYLGVRILLTLATLPDVMQTLMAARYDGHTLPPVVCAPDAFEGGTLELYPTLYAVIPSMMVAADQPCDMHLTP